MNLFHKKLLFISILLLNILLGQKVIKRIKFKNKKIEKTNMTKNRLAVLFEKDYIPHYTLYDNKGNSIYKSKRVTNYFNNGIVSDFDSFVMGVYEENKSHGFNLKAIDIKTGRKKWALKISPARLSRSPNGHFALTYESPDPASDHEGRFRIIDLKNGKYCNFPKEIWNYSGRWLDNNRAFILTGQDTVLKPSKPNKKVVKYRKQEDKIKKRINNLYTLKPETLEISVKKYNKKKKKLIEKKRRVHRKIRASRDINRNNKEVLGLYIVYNVKTRSIESQGYLPDGKGGKSLITGFDNIFADNNSIYLFANERAIRYVYDYQNQKFNIKWNKSYDSFPISDFNGLYIEAKKQNDKMRLIYPKMRGNKKYEINISDGSANAVSNNTALNKKASSISNSNFKIDKENNTILFLGGSNE